VFVAHDADGSAPVVLETNPTYPNLFGRIEHHGVFGGGFVTDHRMLRPGAVHRANGGYLMLPAAGGGPGAAVGVAEAQGGAAHWPDPP
jgi:predicted ATP-dependent protease